MDEKQFAKFMEVQTALFDKLLSEHRQQDQSPAAQGISATQGSIINTALLPSFECFDPKKESFRNYKQRFENYLVMKNIFDNKEYCARLLLNSIDAKNFNMITALAAPKIVSEMKYKELIELLEKHLAPKKNIFVAQHQFLSKYQTQQQSISEYIATLRSDIGDCEFISPCRCKNSIADIFLRAQFIRGIQDNSIREQLLQSKTSSFDEIVSKAIALETSKIDSKEISQKNSQNPTTDINMITQKTKKKDHQHRNRSQNRQRQTTSKNQSNIKNQTKSRLNYNELGIEGLCFRCGKDNHLSNECRTDKSNLKCANCSRTGHVAKVCIRSLLEKKNKPESKISNTSANQIQEESVFKQYGIHHIVDIYQNSQPAAWNSERYCTHVNVEGKSIKFEVDSGSGFTFLPRDQFAQLKFNVPLLPVNIGFRSYTKNVFVPDGKIKVNVNYNRKMMQDEIYIVPEEYAAILGRTWIRGLKIDLNEIDCQHSTEMSTYSIKNINDVDEIMKEYSDIFEEKIGCVPKFKVTLKLRDKATPIFHRKREIPYALSTQVEKELDSLEAAGIITKIETSDWGSPLVVIPKTDGGVRLCVDYKIGVNERLINSHYPIRRIDDILNSLRNSRYFCRLDLFKAYLHIPVDEKSSDIQTIVTHRGIYRMNRLSFGIKTAPAEFNRIIDQILREIPKTESYFDDIIVHGATKEECKGNLIACFNQLREFNLHLNQRKCSLFQECIEFLGHKVEHNQISKSPEKIKAIVEMPRPTSTDGVRKFLGMVTYYARFIQNTSMITAPLRKLLKKDATFKWTSQCEAAFVQLKQEIASDKVLTPFDPKLDIQLTCDASPTGIAGILSHIINGQEKPIAFASRSLTQAEQNYSQLDREALAIVFSVDYFFKYLLARPFKLVTDNRPLVRIFHQNSKLPKMTAIRLQRYAAFLSGFNYEIEFKKGSENTNADCLSRAPIKPKLQTDSLINDEVHQLCEQTICQIANQNLTFQLIRSETLRDGHLLETLRKLQEEDDADTEFTIDNDIVFRGQRIVIPSTLQEAVLQELHRTHIGISKMKQLARRYVYWKNIDKDIERLVRACPACVNIKNSPNKVPLHPWEEPDNNWQRIHIDYAGPFQGHHFLVIIDAKSKWAEIQPCSAAPTSVSTIEILQDIFARNGFPDIIVSDNATIFTSEEFKTFCKEAGIFQKFTAPGHPATDGLAERNIQTLKRRLEAMKDEPLSMHQKVREILFRYRTPLKNGKTPAGQYLHREIRIHLDVLKPIKFKMSNVPVIKARQLNVGERVQARYYTSNKEQWKLGTIIKKFGQLHYLIKLDDGYTFKRHIDQLRLTDVKPKKSVLFAPGIIDEPVPKSNKQEPNLGDLVQIPEREKPVDVGEPGGTSLETEEPEANRDETAAECAEP